MTEATDRGALPGGGNEALLDEAVAALRAGAVVAIPTDTVYGLAVDPRRAGATESLFTLKGRPSTLELPILVADLDQAATLAGSGGLPPVALRLAHRFWPGPLTIVVARAPTVAWRLGGNGRTIGLRCPAHPVALWLCATVGPLATTSANRHGEPPLATAAGVMDAFGEAVAVIVDAGVCAAPPSTVVDATGDTPRQLREGSVPWADIERAAEEN